MDPFLDIVGLLRPRAMLLGRGLDACGRWGISFPKKDDFLFFWVENGECLLLRPKQTPSLMRSGDFALIRTSSPFTLASDLSAASVESEVLVAQKKQRRLTLGSGTDLPIRLHMGKFIFESANEDLLTSMLPSLVHVEAGEPSLDRVHSLLALIDSEAQDPGPASEFILLQLIKLVLVEILRTGPLMSGAAGGLLAGLRDPLAGRAIRAMHMDVARSWTVDTLAGLCSVSRSTFATRFRAVVGVGPIEYLLQWRMALAKDALRAGSRSVEEIGLAVGFQSASAFSTAFRRSVGCSPTRFAKGSTSGLADRVA